MDFSELWKRYGRLATDRGSRDQFFIAGDTRAIGLRFRFAAATLLELHRWNAQTRSVSDGFVGGRCGGAAPAQGRPLAADRPEQHECGKSYNCC